MPAAASWSSSRVMNGRPATSTRALGRSATSARRRVPRPPASSRAVTPLRSAGAACGSDILEGAPAQEGIALDELLDTILQRALGLEAGFTQALVGDDVV